MHIDGVNLVPMERRQARRRRARTRLWVGVGTTYGSLWVGAAVAAIVVFTTDNRSLRAELSDVAGEVDKSEVTVAGLRADLVEALFRQQTKLQRRDKPGQIGVVPRLQAVQALRQAARLPLDARHHVVDHALKAHFPPVLGRIDAADAVILYLGDLAVLQPLNRPQQQDRPIFGPQVLDGLLDPVVDVLPVQRAQVPGRARLVGTGLVGAGPV